MIINDVTFVVTQAARAAKFMPGTLVPVEVTDTLRGPVGGLPTVGDKP